MVRGSELRKQTLPIASISLGLIDVLHEAAAEPQCHDDEHDNKDASHALGRLACGLRAVNAHLIHLWPRRTITFPTRFWVGVWLIPDTSNRA